jgi:hypothetical protein
MNNAVIWAEAGDGLVVGSLRRVLSLDFQSWNFRLEVSDFIPWGRSRPQPAIGGAGPDAVSCRVACAIGRTIGPR